MYLVARRTASMATSKQSDGGGRRDDRQRGVAVPAKDGLEEIRLLRLGRQAGGRAGALGVDQHEWQLSRDGEPKRLRLERDPRTRRRRHSERAGERRADGRADGGDFILGLEGDHAVRPEAHQGVEHRGGRRNRIAGKDHALQP